MKNNVIHNFFQTHQYKILLGAPIIFLLFMTNSGASNPASNYTWSADRAPFLTTGTAISVTLVANTKNTVNALGGTVTYPHDILAIEKLSKESSVIELWTEEPAYSNENGAMHFSGGIVGKDEALRNAHVITLELRALRPGKATLRIKDGMLLAQNGEGTNLLGSSEGFTIWVRNPTTPTPDVSGDGTLSIGDINATYRATFRGYEERYDVNHDGRVNWSDVKYLSALMN